MPPIHIVNDIATTHCLFIENFFPLISEQWCSKTIVVWHYFPNFSETIVPCNINFVSVRRWHLTYPVFHRPSSFIVCGVSLKHDGTDWTVKMASCLSCLCLTDWSRRQDLENGQSTCPKLGKSCWRGRGTNAAVASFRSCRRFCASSSLRFASLTLHDLVHQTANKNCCVLPHKNFISSVSFNALRLSYIGYYFHCLSACILYSLSRLLVMDTGMDRQTGLFHYVPSFSDPSAQRTDKRTFSIVPSAYSRRDGPFSRFCLRVPSVQAGQTGHFHCPVMF